MSFAAEFESLPLETLSRRALTGSSSAVRESLERPKASIEDFAHLLSPAAGEQLETMSRRSQQLTQQRFGRVIRLFAPLYLSNERLGTKACSSLTQSTR